MSKEAMKLALEALEAHADIGIKSDKAITALREALAEQPAQQEPVAWMDIDENGTFSGLRYWSESDNRHEVALYTSPPAQHTWVELTNEEIQNLLPDDDTPMSLGEAFVKFAILVEAKLKEKNT